MRSQVARRNLSSQELRNLRTLLLLNVLEPEEIGGRIKLARERAGLRQEDLADLVNVSTRTIQNYEAGDTKQYSALQLIARATAVSVEWLLHGDRDPQPDEGGSALREVLDRLQAVEQTQEENTEMLVELLRIARVDGEHPQADAEGD